jgi:hypothetical protein
LQQGGEGEGGEFGGHLLSSKWYFIIGFGICCTIGFFIRIFAKVLDL